MDRCSLIQEGADDGNVEARLPEITIIATSTTTTSLASGEIFRQADPAAIIELVDEFKQQFPCAARSVQDAIELGADPDSLGFKTAYQHVDVRQHADEHLQFHDATVLGVNGWWRGRLVPKPKFNALGVACQNNIEPQ